MLSGADPLGHGAEVGNRSGDQLHDLSVPWRFLGAMVGCRLRLCQFRDTNQQEKILKYN